MAKYTGISFPFRLGIDGKVLISTVNDNTSKHIDESIEQILHTNFGERVMESHIYSDIQDLLFRPNDESLQSLMSQRIIRCLKELEKRIRVDEDLIRFSVENNYLFCTITYTVLYTKDIYESTFELGEVKDYE